MRIYIVEDNLLPAHYRQSLSSSSLSYRSSLNDPNFKSTRRWHQMNAKTQIKIVVCSNSARINIFLVLLIRSVGDRGALSNQNRQFTTPIPAQKTILSEEVVNIIHHLFQPPFSENIFTYSSPHSPQLLYIASQKIKFTTIALSQSLWLWSLKLSSTDSELKIYVLCCLEKTP